MIKCAKCRNEKDDVEFVRGNSVFLPNGRSYLCLECLEKMVDVDDLDEMDGLMRWLDVPFDVNLLMNVRRGSKNGRRGVLRAYFNELYDSKYDGGGWKEENERWKRIREEKKEDEDNTVCLLTILERIGHIATAKSYAFSDMEKCRESKIITVQNYVASLVGHNVKYEVRDEDVICEVESEDKSRYLCVTMRVAEIH